MKLTALFSSLFLTTFAAGEAIHLVNCNGGPQPISMVAYYADDHNPTQPPSDNVCLMSYGPYFYWETGIYEYCKFPTGVEFKFNIEVVAQAPGVGDYSDVGYGSNGYRKFNCFKDDKHQLFSGSRYGTCYSIYYCLPY